MITHDYIIFIIFDMLVKLYTRCLVDKPILAGLGSWCIIGLHVECGFYALSASKAMFTART